MHKHKNMVYFQAITSIVNLVLNLMFIPKYSAFGASIAIVVSEGLLLIIVIVSGTKYVAWNLKDVFFMLSKPTIAGLIALGLTYGLLISKTNLFLQIFFLLSSYFLFLFAVKTFSKDDKELFIKIFMKKSALQ